KWKLVSSAKTLRSRTPCPRGTRDVVPRKFSSLSSRDAGTQWYFSCFCDSGVSAVFIVFMTEKPHAYVDSLRSKNAHWVTEVIDADADEGFATGVGKGDDCGEREKVDGFDVMDGVHRHAHGARLRGDRDGDVLGMDHRLGGYEHHSWG